MTCKDCIHFEACTCIADCFMAKLKEESAESCDHFREATKMIELPCKVGATVWVIDDGDDYSGYVFLGCNENYAFLGGGINGSFDVDDICQYGFEKFQEWDESAYIVPLNKMHFTKEEAEQALKEREKSA